MRHHIILNRSVNFEEALEAAQIGQRPRHGMWLLAQILDAQIYGPNNKELIITRKDRLRSKLIGSPESWAFAQSLATRVNSKDCLYCNSEEVGLQVAAVCGVKEDRPKLALFVHNLMRPRGYLALKLWQVAKHIDLFLACSQQQVDFLRQYLGLPETKVRFIWDHTDTHFFNPGASNPALSRPQVISVGLEQRDYRTVATATADLDVDVRISGFSKDAAKQSRTFPEQLPANMQRRFYPWTELVELYRNATVVVVSLYPNRYAAGVQSLMEAMACRRPVIVTATEGLTAYLDPSFAVVVEPGDTEAMRAAILDCIQNPEAASKRAEKGYEVAKARHDMDSHVQKIANYLQNL